MLHKTFPVHDGQLYVCPENQCRWCWHANFPWVGCPWVSGPLGYRDEAEIEYPYIKPDEPVNVRADVCRV